MNTQTAQHEVTSQSQEHTVKIGFEQALIQFNPNWRTEMTQEQVNHFRHFYHRGHVDTGFLIQMSNQTMQQNLEAVMNTVIVTGNEEQIAAAQRQAAEQEAEKAAKAKPRRKATPPAKTAGLKSAAAKASKTNASKALAKAVAKKGKK